FLAALGIGACGSDSDKPTEPAPRVGDPGPIHVHGLGVNPTDGALFVATHTGLFRAAAGEQRARRVADRYQDTMGFTVTGPDRFLGSGHPDGRAGLPPFLGLIRSTDAGRTWEPVSLLGKRDFHVLEALGKRVYGYGSDYETRQPGLLVSDDGGRSWQERVTPEPLLSLAIDPDDPDRVVASGEDGSYSSTDAGGGWRPLGEDPGWLAWTGAGALFLVGLDGAVVRSTDGGRTWEQTGNTGGQPAALESVGDELYVALHDGSIKRSQDQGRSWQLRSRP
ncbi:MAG: F510_1955 family glycosylhydrolase, partial [Pseudonocardiaceae bacterium]